MRNADALAVNVLQRFEARAGRLRRRQIGHQRKARDVAALARDYRHRALARKIEQAASEGGHADIDIARCSRNGDWLRRIEELQFNIESGFAEIAAVGGDEDIAGRGKP